MTSSYFIFAGESSGDLHGSNLMQAIKNINPSINFRGVGGPLMRSIGMECLIPMESFQVMGFTDIIKALPLLIKNFYKIRNAILKSNPASVILIDYPGFNLRLAKNLRKNNFKGKIIQYVCPSIWAHGKNRIQILCENYDLLLTILPFESDYFSHTILPVKYVGHPLIETIAKHVYDDNWKAQLNVPKERPLISLFPGSRYGEIKRNLPIQLASCQMLKNKLPNIIFGLSCAHSDLIEPIKKELKKTSLILNKDLFLVPRQYRYELMKDSHTALAKSGTVTLELALHQKPSLVIYQLTKLNYWIAKNILKVRLPFYCLPNILGKKNIFPELIDKKISPSMMFDQLQNLHLDQTKRELINNDCNLIRSYLGSSCAHTEAAKAIVGLNSC